ncbi:unnamed protein product [Cyclocybe aegerita]|uniref:PIPK domain-containing protein n=1 Tax=Cyclocybe aegerita TaxID=1973307 RepID=A0A8S0WKB6_CYCAE|nr:unnamed protein product [Cyclocybe aegerita]
MANHKPLPALPPSSETTTLSVDARNHRARLIRHFLSDIHEPALESRRDGWAYVLEEVLDELSLHISSGDWLSSIKRGKKLKRKRAQEEADKHSRPAAIEKVQKRSSNDSHKEETASESALAVKPLPSTPEPPLKQLRQLAARPPSHEELRAGHLVLCLAPHGSRIPLPAEDSGFDLVPANIGCAFSPGSFSLQDPGQDEVGTVLYGLDGLEVNVLDTNLRLVGGTFAFKGVNTPVQHHLLFKVLKLAIFVHLSLVLEQNLLAASGVPLKLPRPKMPPPSPSTPTSPSAGAPQEPKQVRIKARNTIIPSSFTNFFLKRNLSYRGAQTISVAGDRRGSLDLTVLPPSSSAAEEPPHKPAEGVHGLVSNLRLRRFSFIGDRRHSLRKSLHLTQEKREQPPSQPFVNALKRIEGSKDLLSTSAGVSLRLPKLIVDLADQEKARAALADGHRPGQSRRLKGDERAALTSLLGWDGKDAEGRGMSGILGFVRQQEISVLCSLHVPPSTVTPTGTISHPPTPSSSTTTSEPSEPEKVQVGSSTFTNATTSTAATISTLGTLSNRPSVGHSPCGKPHWLTFRYFSSNPNDDQLLGEWVLDTAKGRNSPCSRPGCTFLKGQHEQRIIHDGIRIVIRVGEDDKMTEDGKEEEEEKPSTEDDVRVWESCAVCNASTKRTKLSDGAYLFSFAKYLELLIHSPFICTLDSPLCEHTTPLSTSIALPPSRFNIIRHFSTASTDITLALSTIEDIFEIRAPRLQITRGVEKPSPPQSSAGRKQEDSESEEEPNQKKILRKEIRKWWEGVADHIDKIELVLNNDTPGQKSLPRLPSIDDAYDVFDSSPQHSGATTPTASTPFPLPPLPPTAPNSPSFDTPKDGVPKDSYFTTLSNMSTDTQASKAPTIPPKDNSEQLLATLRHNFQRIEQSLYAQLARTPESALNDVRRSFIATGRGTQKRLKAWQAKHLGAAKAKTVGDLIAQEPEWWGKGCHVVPTGNIIVREYDWGSIIAHTLSTTDYQMEMANLSVARTTSTGTQSTTNTPAAEPPNSSSSFFSVATSYKLFSLSAKTQPDPDQEDVVWNEPEQYSAVISRKDYGRDPTAFVSIRDVLRPNKTASEQSGAATASRSNVATNSAPGTSAPPSAFVKVKPNVGLSTESAGGQLNGQESTDAAGKILQELENETPTHSRPASIKSELPSSMAFGNAHIRRGKASSIISTESRDSQKTIGKEKDKVAESAEPQPSSLPPPPLPPKDDGPKEADKEKAASNDKEVVASSDTALPPPSKIVASASAPPPTSSGFASVLATGIGSAVRYVLSAELPSRTVSPAATNPPKKHHNLLLADMGIIDERPHIKYDWTIGKRIKFSCTVYYAKQFDALRRRCGIHDVFLKSLSRSTNWTAEGGKSRSNFWKTSDDRFIIKTLVNAWNVADLQVLIDHAPSYFRYMDATASKPTVLAKLIGFYTIEVRNLETGNVQSKADLLVMENLFFGQNISKTFDLKGIQGRKIKTQGNGTTKTLFDGEWIEGQQRTLTLVRPYSKVILRDAIKSDAEFLAKSNIMDYSLLLGVDEENKQIACGLVDTIGSYTFAKTLEYKAKQGLQSGKEITVVPPAEYQERFVSALEGYFVACPDKWSKPQDESKIISDPNLLPSVL